MAKFKGSKFKQGDTIKPPPPKKCTACAGSGVYDHNGSPVCKCCNGTGIEQAEWEIRDRLEQLMKKD